MERQNVETKVSSKILLAFYRDMKFGLGERPNTKRSLY